jgi:hypothetical protein
MAKTKTVQASLIDFCFFSANPTWLGSSLPIGDIRGYFFYPAAQRPWVAESSSLVKPLLLQSPMTSLLLPRNPTCSEQTIRRRSAKWFALTTRTKCL